jgi:hypothetical protein
MLLSWIYVISTNYLSALKRSKMHIGCLCSAFVRKIEVEMNTTELPQECGNLVPSKSSFYFSVHKSFFLGLRSYGRSWCNLVVIMSIDLECETAKYIFKKRRAT